jgi:hypothetical protein
VDVEGVTREGAEEGRELGPQPKSAEGPAVGVEASVDAGERARAVGAGGAKVAAAKRDCEAVRAEDCTAETV